MHQTWKLMRYYININAAVQEDVIFTSVYVSNTLWSKTVT